MTLSSKKNPIQALSLVLIFSFQTSSDAFQSLIIPSTIPVLSRSKFSSCRFAENPKDSPAVAASSSSLSKEESPKRKECTIRLPKSGRDVTLISRTIPIHDAIIQNITVWEWKNPSEVVDAYWDAQLHKMTTMTASSTAFSSQDPKSPSQLLLDPFGLMTWPGSVHAARQLCHHAIETVHGRHVVVLGAGVGVETQAVALLGARHVVSTDIHPTTLQQLQVGIDQEKRIREKSDVIETQILDLFADATTHPIPTPCDLLIVADVLYNEQLAKQVCRRCAEALSKNPKIHILITDSQRFVPSFIDDLNDALEAVSSQKGGSYQRVQWHVETMKQFTGSGVAIDDDQTYDVKVQHLWVGL